METIFNRVTGDLLIMAIPSLLNLYVMYRLIVYRIDQLEKKMDKHNSVIEKVAVLQEHVKSAHRRIDFVCEHLRIGGTE